MPTDDAVMRLTTALAVLVLVLLGSLVWLYAGRADFRAETLAVARAADSAQAALQDSVRLYRQADALARERDARQEATIAQLTAQFRAQRAVSDSLRAEATQGTPELDSALTEAPSDLQPRLRVGVQRLRLALDACTVSLDACTERGDSAIARSVALRRDLDNTRDLLDDALQTLDLQTQASMAWEAEAVRYQRRFRVARTVASLSTAGLVAVLLVSLVAQ